MWKSPAAILIDFAEDESQLIRVCDVPIRRLGRAGLAAAQGDGDVVALLHAVVVRLLPRSETPNAALNIFGKSCKKGEGGGEDYLTRAMALATRSCWRSCSVEEATSSVFLRGRTGRLAYGWARQGRERVLSVEMDCRTPKGSRASRASSVKPHRSEKRQI